MVGKDSLSLLDLGIEPDSLRSIENIGKVSL